MLRNKLNNTSKGYEDICVEVVDYVKDIARHAWDCYKMTWPYLQDVAYDETDDRVIGAINNIINYRALPMPREQANITFRINNVSRVMLAQITRQRKAAFNVESQMPSPLKHNVIIPLNIVYNDDLNKKANHLAKLSRELYDECICKGIPPQDARYMALHGQTTSMVYVADINTFCGSFSMRCENNISDEINYVYRLLKKAILVKLKEDYNAKIIDGLSYTFYKSIIEPADAAGSAIKVGKNYDEVFGNSFKRYPDMNEEITNITKKCSYDFKKSAWYLEMLRLDTSLLFDGEDYMISNWKR